jgi:hypothetical protein
MTPILKKKNLKQNPKRSNKLPSKVARSFKKMKRPEEVFKDRASQELIREIYSNFYRKKSNEKDILFSKKFADLDFKRTILFLRSNLKNSFLEDKGKTLHIFLPLTGSSPTGYFYKACFEKVLPFARITFLVTPKIEEYYSADLKSKKQMEKNLEGHIKRSLNVFDNNFLIMDYFSSGNTTNLISKVLSKVRGKDTKIITSDVNESFYKDRVKDPFGKNSMFISESIKSKVPLKEYNRQKLNEKILRYVYYYLGYEYINSLKL